MWDNSQPPRGPFRDRPAEPFLPRWPQGQEPRMRGRPPVPFRTGAVPPGSSYTGHGGGAPYRDMGRVQENVWDEGSTPKEEQMNFPRTGRPLGNFREMANRPLTEPGLAPDMDYREREAHSMEQRNWARPDVDYRHNERMAIGYRERLSPPPNYRDQKPPDYRRIVMAETKLQEREALELEYRQRLAAALDYRQREAIDMDYKIRLDALIKRREREEMMLREREYTERLMRDRVAVEMMRHRDATALSLQKKGGADLMGKESSTGFLERHPLPVESKSLAYGEAGKAEYQPHDASMMDTRGFGTRDQDAADVAVTQADALHGGQDKGNAQTGRADFKQHIDTDYRDTERVDSDYRKKESADSDYRDRETAVTDYREMETADSDYREKESSYMDYRERADADYRHGGDGKGNEKEAAKVPKVENGNKPQAQVKPAVDYTAAPLEDDHPVFGKVKGTLGKDEIPFLSYYKQPPPSSLSSSKAEAPPSSSNKSGAQSKAPPGRSGNMDTDFRGRPSQSDNSGAKEEASKPVAYPMAKASGAPCAGDQDLRGNNNVNRSGGDQDLRSDNVNRSGGDQDLRGNNNVNRSGGDQDLRTHGPMQQKDEDLRSGEPQAAKEFLSKNALLLDFLILAAKQLKHHRGQTEDGNQPENIATPPPPTIAKPDPDISGAPLPGPSGMPLPGPSGTPVQLGRPGEPIGSRTSEIGFLGGEDTDYRSIDFKDVDLRPRHSHDGHDKRVAEKRSHEDSDPGAKDKDYRRISVPAGASKIIWMDGLPTGVPREEIMSALGANKLPEDSVNLIGYIPGYSLGSVCVEFSLVEEAVGCMEAHKGVLHFKGKKVNLKYIPNSEKWMCLQCKAANVISKERCWQCSALRAGSDHLLIRDPHKDPKPSPSLSSTPSKKRKAKQSPPRNDRPAKKGTLRQRSPPARKNRDANPQSSTVIIWGIGANATQEGVVKLLQPYVTLAPSSVRLVKNHKNDRRGFGFIDLKSHKEAMRLTVLVRELKPPITINGKPVTIDIAVGKRKNEQGKKGNKSSLGKNRKQRGQKKGFTYPGYKAADDDGTSYIYDSKTGCYVDPLTGTSYSERKKDDGSRQDSESQGKPPARPRRRGFTEEEEDDDNEDGGDAFKKPLPPAVVKKEEPPPEPKVNPLLGLLGAYVDDSEEEEDEEPPLFPVPKKPTLPPAPVAAPKPAPAAPTGLDDEKMTDWKKLVCLLCRRQFPSKEVLIRHQHFSDLHKQNVALHQKAKKSQKELVYLQQREHEEAAEGLDADGHIPEKKGPDTRSELGDRKRVKASANQKPAGESYRENMKRLILERYKELE